MVEVALYGKPSSRYEYLKMFLRRKSEENNIQLSITEINDVDIFIKDNVLSIPAVRVGKNKLLECHQEDDIYEFTNDVLAKLLNVKKSSNKIIVPVDFSEHSSNALKYAAALASDCGCDIELVHIYHPTPVQVNGQVWVNPEGEKPFEEQLEKWWKEAKTEYDDISFSYELIFGFPAGELVKASKTPNTKFIVMGTAGNNEGIQNIFGSVSQEVAQKAHCPVFVIPPDCEFKYERILYATDNPSLDVNALQVVKELAEKLKAHIQLVHIQTDDNVHTNNWINDIPVVIPELQNFDISTVKDTSITNGLLDAAQKDNSDLIVLATKHRTFWEGIFHKSTTKELLKNLSKYPLLVHHSEQ